jgi:chromosome segregation ATPase
METPNYPWSLWAYCPTTKKKTLVARGPESEMRNIFDRLVRRDDRLELIDAAGDKQSTTAGALTDHAGPEAINCRTLQLDFPPGRLNALSVRIADLERLTKANANQLDAIDLKRSEGLMITDARLSDQVRRLSDLERLTKTNSEDITNDRAEARHLAETVGNIHHDLKGAVGDLRRDLETLAAQVDETTQAVAKLATINASAVAEIEDRVTADKRVALSHAASVGELYGDLRRDLEDLAAQVDETAKAVATAQPVASPDAPATLRDDLNSLEVEFGESLGEISRLRNQCKETAAAVAKITSALSILSAFNRPTAPPNA